MVSDKSDINKYVIPTVGRYLNDISLVTYERFRTFYRFIMLNTKKFGESITYPLAFKKKNILNFLTDKHFFVTPKFSKLEVYQPCSISVSKTWFLLMSQKI